jgi:clusterin-associated protein 1
MKTETVPPANRTFKQMRELLSLLRILGYPRLLSLESFRTPNFKLVAEILFWLCGKIQQDHQISSNINREKERVQFMLNVCQLFSAKFRLRITPLLLYKADYSAIPELLKLGTHSKKNNSKCEWCFGQQGKVRTMTPDA